MNSQIFFIVGVQRSGTTLLATLLGKHPDVLMEPRSIAFRIVTCFKNMYELLPHNTAVDKQDFLQWLVRNDIEGRLAKLIDKQCLEEGDNIQSWIQKSILKKLKSQQKTIWGDKSPNLQHFMGDTLLLMPQAKIIHIVRDGRANAHSMSRRSHRNLYLSAQQWVDGNTCGLVNQQILGEDRYKILRYEDLLTQPHTELQSVCDFLGLPFREEMLDLSNSELEEEKRYVKSRLMTSKIDAWRQQIKPKALRRIEEIQGHLLERLGYTLDYASTDLQCKQLPLWQQLWYNQCDNFKQLFRRKSEGMRAGEKITLKRPFKNRFYDFFKVLIKDFLSLKIFKAIFSRFFYRKKYYQNDK